MEELGKDVMVETSTATRLSTPLDRSEASSSRTKVATPLAPSIVVVIWQIFMWLQNDKIGQT